MTQASVGETRVEREERQLVVFDLGGEAYGVEINEVREIIRIQDVTATPQSPWFVEGVINLRGKVIPVVDLRKRFGLEIRDETKDTRIVVVDIENTDIGMIVDAVNEVMRIPMSDVEPPSSVVTSRDSDYLLGIAKTREKMIILLDLQQVLNGAGDAPPPPPRPRETVSETATSETDHPASLYDELGGEPAITAAVEQFYDRVLADATLAHFFDPERLDGLKRQQRAFLTQALGGPADYSGRPLREAHAGLGITDEHFTAVAGHLAQTLAALGIPDELAGRVLEAVASLRSEVVQAD